VNRLLWPELEPDAAEQGWLADVPRATTDDVLGAIARRHPMDGWKGPGRWVFCREVNEATGLWGQGQRFDAVAVGLVPSVKYARVIYEVKVSRSDWLRELRPLVDVGDRHGRLSRRLVSAYQTEDGLGGLDKLRESGYDVVERRKWDAALALSTEFWIAAPPHVVQVDELPPEAGLVEVRPWGPSRELRPRVIRPAPVRETPHPGHEFWAAVLRRTAGFPASPPEAVE
jgi:hypothetical protein